MLVLWQVVESRTRAKPVPTSWVGRQTRLLLFRLVPKVLGCKRIAMIVKARSGEARESPRVSLQ